MKHLNKLILTLIVICVSVGSLAKPIIRGYPTVNDIFPNDLTKFKPIKVMTGGTGGVLILEDPDTKKWFTFKCSSDLAVSKEEILTDALYRTLGVPVPDFAIYTDIPKGMDLMGLQCSKGGPFRLAEFIKSDPDSDKKFEKTEKEFAKHFVIDALLANWDAVVFKKEWNKYKNLILDPKGVVWRIDNGGSLRYRAKGTLKSSILEWDANKVVELDNLRNKKLNKTGAKVYGALSEDEIEQQVLELLPMAPLMLKTISDLGKALKIDGHMEIRNMLINRLNDLQKGYLDATNQKAWLGSKKFIALPDITAAGAFTYSIVNNEPYVMLGKRVKHRWWGIFGGKSEPDHQTLLDTAEMEINQEALGLFQFTRDDFKNAPSHDAVNPLGLFRTYFMAHDYVAPEKFMEKYQAATKHYEKEHTDFIWVRVKDLISSVNKGPFIQEEGQWTAKVKAYRDIKNKKDEIEIILHAPFFESIRQEPALDVMMRLVDKNKLDVSRSTIKFKTFRREEPQPLKKLRKIDY